MNKVKQIKLTTACCVLFLTCKHCLTITFKVLKNYIFYSFYQVVEEEQTEPLLESMIVADMSTLNYPPAVPSALQYSEAITPIQSRPSEAAHSVKHSEAYPPSSYSTPIPSSSGNFARASSPRYSTPPPDPSKPHQVNIPSN